MGLNGSDAKPLNEENVFDELRKLDLDGAFAFLSITLRKGDDGRMLATATAFTAFDGGPLPQGHRIMRDLVEAARTATRMHRTIKDKPA